MKSVLCLVLFLVGIDVIESQCPDNWVTFQGQCYLFAHDPKTFTEAEHFCLQRGAHLAHIYSNVENLFLGNMCKDLVRSAHWIGLTDIVIEGIWRWKHSGETANFTDWNPSEPTGDNTDNCVVMWPDFAYRWGDIYCSYAGARPICQKPVSSHCENEVSIVG